MIGVGGGNGDGNGVGGRNGDVNGHGDGDRVGTGAGSKWEQGRGWRPVDEHRVETGTEARPVAEMRTGTRITGPGTRIGSGRAE